MECEYSFFGVPTFYVLSNNMKKYQDFSTENIHTFVQSIDFGNTVERDNSNVNPHSMS